MLPYMAKLSNGKAFAVVHFSLENFHSVSGRGHHVLYTARDSRGKLSRSAKKPTKVFPFESFAVYGIISPCIYVPQYCGGPIE